MMQDRPDIKQLFRKNIFGVFAAMALVVFLAGGFFLQQTPASSAFLSYAGDNIQSVSATLESTQGTQELQLGAAGSYSPVGPTSFPYKITSSLRSSNIAAQDFVFSLSQDGKKIGVRVDGFSPEDTVSLTLNHKAAFDNIPMDWSGRMELVADIAGNNPVEACVEIGESGITVCHTIPEAHRA